MHAPKRKSVYGHFLGIILPACTVVFISLIAFFEWSNYNKAISDLTEKLDTLSSAYSLLYAEPVEKRNSTALQLYSISLQSDTEIAAIEIKNKQGMILESFGDFKNIDPKFIRHLKITYATMESIRYVGYLSMAVTPEGIHTELSRRITYEVVLLIALLLVVLISALMAFRKAVGEPLNRLTTAIHDYKKHGTHETVAVRRNDELGMVIDAYNNMQKIQSDSQQELLEHQKQLEQEVEKRTQELLSEQAEHTQTSIELYDEAHRAQITLDSISEAVITTDKDSKVQFMNPAASSLTGIPKSQAINNNILRVLYLVDSDTRDPIPEAVLKYINSDEPQYSSMEALLISANNKEYFVEIKVSILKNETGQITGSSIIIRDITESQRLTDRLSYQASHDPLTELCNRREFISQLEHLITNSKDTDMHHALFFLDLDDFKNINDNCGHEAGDEVLKEIATELKSYLRGGDLLARLGGDEFGVLLINCEIKHAQKIGDKMRKGLERYTFTWNGNDYKLGVSIGIVSVHSESGSAKEILRHADQSCYKAKGLGRNRIHLYPVK